MCTLQQNHRRIWVVFMPLPSLLASSNFVLSSLHSQTEGNHGQGERKQLPVCMPCACFQNKWRPFSCFIWRKRIKSRWRGWTDGTERIPDTLPLLSCLCFSLQGSRVRLLNCSSPPPPPHVLLGESDNGSCQGHQSCCPIMILVCVCVCVPW